MLKSLKLINAYISGADPEKYNSISYGKYYRDLTSISNSVLEDAEEFKKKEIKILAELNDLPESAAKQKIIRIIQGLPPLGGGTTAG